MIDPRQFADSYQPAFGAPYPKWTQEQLEALTQEQLRDLHRVKAEVAEAGKRDPIVWGWTLDNWRECMARWKQYAVHVILGGNRSAKSTYASRLAVWVAMTIPEAKVYCWHVNEERSISEQQAMVWDALPEEFKLVGKKKGLNYSIQYTQKNGFSGNKLILPPVEDGKKGSEIFFMNYRQYQADAQVAEGWKAHLIWCDEECPQKLFETMQYRLVDYHGRLVLTFTTLQGWTPLVQDVLGRVKTLKTRFSTLMKRELPYVQESLTRAGCCISYFWTEDNVFVDSRQLLATLVGRPEAERLARAHGIPTKSSKSPFPSFDELVHVVEHEKLPWMKPRFDEKGRPVPYRVTRYMAVDPAGSKNWFMLWMAIDPRGVCWVYREWPDIGYGMWADSGSDEKGKAGPAQEGQGFGINDYVELIQGLEDGETIFERYIDSRLGTAEVQGRNGATSIATELADAGMDFIPAPGLDIEHGLQLINSRLSYNREDAVTATNHPKLYVSSRCEQLIYALKNFTGQGGKNEATKDPIDVLRYLLESGCDYVNEKQPQATGTFSY